MGKFEERLCQQHYDAIEDEIDRWRVRTLRLIAEGISDFIRHDKNLSAFVNEDHTKLSEKEYQIWDEYRDAIDMVIEDYVEELYDSGELDPFGVIDLESVAKNWFRWIEGDN